LREWLNGTRRRLSDCWLDVRRVFDGCGQRAPQQTSERRADNKCNREQYRCLTEQPIHSLHLHVKPSHLVRGGRERIPPTTEHRGAAFRRGQTCKAAAAGLKSRAPELSLGVRTRTGHPTGDETEAKGRQLPHPHFHKEVFHGAILKAAEDIKSSAQGVRVTLV
jgi:hypothetical protein